MQVPSSQTCSFTGKVVMDYLSNYAENMLPTLTLSTTDKIRFLFLFNNSRARPVECRDLLMMICTCRQQDDVTVFLYIL